MKFLHILIALISATVMACSGEGSSSPTLNNATLLVPGQSIKLVSGQTIKVPSGATVQFPNSGITGNMVNGDNNTVNMTSGSVMISGDNNTVNTTAGAVVSVPAGATGPADNIVVAAPSATLSADQAAFESFFLSPNAAYACDWHLPLSGMPQDGTHYFEDNYTSIPESPLTNGPQIAISSSLTSIAITLGVMQPGTTRYLVNAQVVTGSIAKMSYQGTGVRYDILAADGVTTVYSDLRSNFSVVPLSGTVVSAPTDLAHWGNALFYNPSLLNPSATWVPGAAYMKFTATYVGDIYEVVDWGAATTGNTPSPVATNSTIAALISAGGIVSSSDGTTYDMSNGNVSVINGVNTYVAINPIPNVTGTRYRTFYELNGDVYGGILLKDGTVAGGDSFPVAAPGTPSGYTVNYSATYQIRLNKAAVNSIQSAVTF